MKETIGSILYNARMERNMSVKELSYAADVAPRTIYTWENNIKSPALSNLQKICKALQISIKINENGEVTRES